MKNIILWFGLVLPSFIITANIPDNNNYSAGLIPVQQVFMRVNNIQTAFCTDGIFNHDKFTFPGGSAGFIWPVSSSAGNTLSFATGLWVGAKVGPQRELRAAGCIYNSHYSPGNIPVIGQVPPASVCSDNSFKGYLVNLTDQSLFNGGVRTRITGGITYTFTYDAWANWPVNKGAPYVEVNHIPGYQPGWNSDRPGIWHTTARPDEIAFMVYMDYTNCTNNIHTLDTNLPGGTLPLGAEVQQLSFAFLSPGLTDAYFINWRIINKSSQQWDSTYFTIVDDTRLGSPTDDAAGCDSVKQLAYIYNYDNDDEGFYGPNPPALGYKILECPISYTGNNSDTAHLPYGNFAGYKLLKMTGYNVFENSVNPCRRFPGNSAAAYNFMRGKDGCGNTIISPITGNPTTFKNSGGVCPRSGWYDSTSGPCRHLLSVGPLRMNSGEDRFLLALVLVARGSDNLNSVCKLKENSTQIEWYYQQSLGGDPIGINLESSEVSERFMLYQNYPNPFNPSTKIRFSIPPLGNGSNRSVQLIIFDALGREVSTLVNEELTSGTYEAEFDGINFASGVYYYKLISGNYVETKKMIFIK
jgi:hypothetical protein